MRKWKTKMSLLAEVRAELKSKRACKRHHILWDGNKHKFGTKIPCDFCGYKFRLSDYSDYRAGYRAAGGNDKEVFTATNERLH